MNLSKPVLALLLAVAIGASGTAIAQTTAASGAATRAEVKGEVKAARANGELPPDANRSQIGDPPVPKARKPKKAKSTKTSASAAQ